MSKKHYYITTAIDYVNSSPHIGTAYEKIGADVLARWQRFLGNEVHFQMGNDEHSINVQKSAAKAGLAPKEYCDQMREKFESTWKQLNISYDGFIQTSEEHHKKGVQKLFQAILDSGDIYQSRYEGWYCESCEAYYTEKDLVNEVCPNHQSKPKWVSEENYFFALKKYNDRILKHLEKNPDFIQPEIRRNEILSLLREGLEDVSVSRSSFDWGIQLPNDNKHVVYVWIDALINYITAIGYGWDEKQFKKWWPAKHHIIGKDITRFHCVIWPAMLMSAGIKLPKTIFGHGFVSFKGEKMSKSLGNVVTPLDVVNLYGADSLRYYLMREGSFGRDSDFTWDNFINRYNGDLANGFGNLLSRTIGMAVRYQAGKIRTPNKKYIGEAEKQLAAKTSALFSQVDQCIATSTNDINFHTALAHIWEGMAAADRYINEYKPWELAKNEEWEKINCVLYHVAENLRISTLLLNAFIPETAAKAWQALGLSEFSPINAASATEAKTWGEIKQEITVQKGIGLFPRIEEKKPAEQAKKTKEKKVEVGTTDLIGIADFAKVELRVAEITEAEKIEDADKLLKLQVNLGEETRQLVAGIAKYYSPADLVGKKVIVVANLKPAKLRGVESQGMLLAASDKNGLTIVSPLNEITVGAKVK